MSTSSDNPFPGLRPFEADWSHLFFGREGQVDALLAALQRSHFVGVVGTSGSGKSSLVRAGLIPALRRGYLAAGSRWRDVTFRPGLDPMKSLARALVDTSKGSANAWQSVEAVQEVLDVSSFGLAEAVRRLTAEDSSNCVIVVDQFEELFRSEASLDARALEERAAFVQLLLTTAEPQSGSACVVLTMRSDYVGECARFRGLPEALNQSQYLVPRLTREQVRDAIEGPIAVHDGTIAPRLVQQLLNDISDAPDDLPLLQHLLMRLWDVSAKDRAAGREIGLDHYTDPKIADPKIGALRSALNVHAEAVLSELTAPEVTIARRIFQRLSEKTSGNREVRRIASLQQLADVAVPENGSLEQKEEIVKKVLKPFAAEGRSFVVQTPQGDVDISHESLLRQWTRLNSWVEEESRSRDQYLRLIDAAGRWDEKVRSLGWTRRRGSLLQRLELNEALSWWRAQAPSRSWASRYERDLPADDTNGRFDSVVRYLSRSRWRRNWLRAGAAAAVGGIVVAAVGFSTLWVRQKSLTNQVFAQRLVTQAEQRQAADCQIRVMPANTLDGCQSSLSVLLLAEAFARAPEETRTVLQQAMQSPLLEANTYRIGAVDQIALSPKGDILAAVGRDNSITLATVGPGLPIETIARDARVSAVAFSPDGRTLAAAGWDGKIEFIASEDGRHLDIGPTPVGGALGPLAYSPGGSLLAASTDGGKDAYGVVKIFSTGDWKTLATVTYGGEVSALVFSPDERLLLTGSQDGTERLLDARTGQERRRATRRSRISSSVAFSPDGNLFATGGSDSIAQVTSVRGEAVARLLHNAPVTKVAFSARGDYLVTATAGGSVQLIDHSSWKPVASVALNRVVRALASSPDGRRMAIASEAGSRLIETATGRELARSEEAVSSVEFSQDGRWLVSGDANGVRVFAVIPPDEAMTTNDQALLVQACTVAGRALTPDERTTFLGTESVQGCPAR